MIWLKICQNDNLSIHNFINWSFYQLIITSTDHFINWSFHQLMISSTDDFIKWWFHQLTISSIDNFINWSFHQLIISSTDHFINWSFHLIWSSSHLINSSVHKEDVFLSGCFDNCPIYESLVAWSTYSRFFLCICKYPEWQKGICVLQLSF